MSAEQAHLLLGWSLITRKNTDVLLSLQFLVMQTSNKTKDAKDIQVTEGDRFLFKHIWESYSTAIQPQWS